MRGASPGAGRSRLARAVGENIRRVRRMRGLTQEALGERSGVDFKYVGLIERGGANCTLEVIERLAGALQVEPARLLAGNPPPGPRPGAGRAVRELYDLLGGLDERGATFVRDVLASYKRLSQPRP